MENHLLEWASIVSLVLLLIRVLATDLQATAEFCNRFSNI